MNSSLSTLPANTVSGALASRCPWCGEDPSAATFTLENLLCAWEHEELGFATRYDDGTAHPCALKVDCPHCARPFMVALKGEGVMLLLPVRTSTDARLLAARPVR